MNDDVKVPVDGEIPVPTATVAGFSHDEDTGTRASGVRAAAGGFTFADTAVNVIS